MALSSSRLRQLLLAAVAALLLASLAPRVLAANTLMAVDLGGEFMKVCVCEREFFFFFFFEISSGDRSHRRWSSPSPRLRFLREPLFLRARFRCVWGSSTRLVPAATFSYREKASRGAEKRRGNRASAVGNNLGGNGKKRRKKKMRLYLALLSVAFSLLDQKSDATGEHHDDAISAHCTAICLKERRRESEL